MNTPIFPQVSHLNKHHPPSLSHTTTHRAFTLLELLVVIAIIGLLSSIVLAAVGDVREKARDARRFSDMRQLQTALELYYDEHGRYPGNTDDNDYGGWDVGLNGGHGSGDVFIQPLTTEGYVSATFGDLLTTAVSSGYRYYRYNAESGGCDSSRGAFYVLGIVHVEGTGRPHPESPGWSCSIRNWQYEFDWVTGAFERP